MSECSFERVVEREKEREREFSTRATFFSFFEEDKEDKEVNSFLLLLQTRRNLKISKKRKK